MSDHKKHRSDSAAAAVQAAQTAKATTLAVPAHVALTASAAPFWEAILRSRAADEWSEADLLAAAELARTQAAIEQYQQELDAEGAVVGGKVSARFKAVDLLVARSLRLTRLLQLHPAGRGIRQSAVEPQRRLERQARAIHEELLREQQDADDLLA